MSLRLYMDVHVSRVITRTLRNRGLDVLTSQEDGTGAEADETLLARATELGRILFSQGVDFLRIASGWQAAGRHFQGVLFAAQRGVSLGLLIQDLDLLLTCCTPEELQDAVTYLPLAP